MVLGLLGSKAIEPIAFDGIPVLDECQLTLDARPLLVAHTPPPAAPISTGQVPAGQLGEKAMAVVHPEEFVPTLLPVDSPAPVSKGGTPLGPDSTHGMS